jgi:hypothetical protein
MKCQIHLFTLVSCDFWTFFGKFTDSYESFNKITTLAQKWINFSSWCWGHQRGLVPEKQGCQAELFNATIDIASQ